MSWLLTCAHHWGRVTVQPKDALCLQSLQKLLGTDNLPSMGIEEERREDANVPLNSTQRRLQAQATRAEEKYQAACKELREQHKADLKAQENRRKNCRDELRRELEA